MCSLRSWVDYSPVMYTHWGSGEPNNANGEEQCVQMNRQQGIEIPSTETNLRASQI